jgi:hypothetical protein
MKRAALFALLVVSCSKTEPEVKKVEADFAPPTSSAVQAPPPAPPPASPPTPSAPAVAAEPPASPKPSEGEWAAGKSLTGDGEERISNHGGCDATKVREWVQILCKPGQEHPWAGDPVSIRVEKGMDRVDPAQSQLTPRADGAVFLVYRFVEGTDVQATFEMAAGRFTLKSTFSARTAPVSEKDPLNVGTFYFNEPASVKECIDRIPPGHDMETVTHMEAQCRFGDEDRRKERIKCHRECVAETSKPLPSCIKLCREDGAAPSAKP